jgi:hypothetical protein
MGLTSKQVAYDNWVLDGGSNICFKFGMWGKCGDECPWYKTDKCDGHPPDCDEEESE